jgi:hypothetical protein
MDRSSRKVVESRAVQNNTPSIVNNRRQLMILDFALKLHLFDRFISSEICNANRSSLGYRPNRRSEPHNSTSSLILA